MQIYGPESSGKTTLALHAIAEIQRTGGRALLIDAEHAFDVKYAESLVSGSVTKQLVGAAFRGCLHKAIWALLFTCDLHTKHQFSCYDPHISSVGAALGFPVG
jgi:RecA/RadA recombinase